MKEREKIIGRRGVCAGGATLILGTAGGVLPGRGKPAFAQQGSQSSQETPAEDEKPPAPGDRLVYLGGERNGEIIRAPDLPLGGPQVQAYPQSPAGLTRDGSRLNLLVVIRLDPADLGPQTASRAAEGVVVYSGVCTHQGCPVNAWSEERKMMVCSCHGSTYDPRHGARLVFGPAPRPLPALPVRIGPDGVLEVAGPFTDQVGAEQM